MRTTKTTEVIEEFDEQGRVVCRTTTTTEETENNTQTVTTYPWSYMTQCGNGGWTTTTTTNINRCDAAEEASTTASGHWDGNVTLKG